MDIHENSSNITEEMIDKEIESTEIYLEGLHTIRKFKFGEYHTRKTLEENGFLRTVPAEDKPVEVKRGRGRPPKSNLDVELAKAMELLKGGK